MSTTTTEPQQQNDGAPAGEGADLQNDGAPAGEQPTESHVLHPIVSQLATLRRERFAEYRSLVARIAGGTEQPATVAEIDRLLAEVGVSVVQFQGDLERGISNLSSPDGPGLRKFLADRKHDLEEEHRRLCERRNEILMTPYHLRQAVKKVDDDKGRELYRYFPDGTSAGGLTERIERAGREIKEYEQEIIDNDARVGVLNARRENIAAELRAMSEQLNATR